MEYSNENNVSSNRGGGSKGHSKRKKLRLTGKVLAVIQFILSVVLCSLAVATGTIPVLYIGVLAFGLLVMVAITFAAQVNRRKTGLNISGIVLSGLLCIGLLFGNFYLLKANNVMNRIGGAAYKVDSMVVVVEADDPAKELLDIKDYQFGRQTTIDQENTNLMIDDINSHFKNKISLASYDTIEEMAAALLDGRIEAAIYNQALLSTVEDSVPGFSEKIKVVYTYGIETPVETAPSKQLNESFNVYISGIDVAGEINTTSRSDVNIIATVNPKTRKILLTTTPRDYYITLPGVSGSTRDKLTHAGIYGVDISMAALETLYDIQMDYYVRVNFTTLIEVVDVMGGIDVLSAYDFSAGGYHFQKGTNHLDGKSALAFCRERYSFAEGDNQRGKNQELVLTAILQKAMNPDVLLKANQILNSLAQSFETNMSKEQIGSLVQAQLKDQAAWSIDSLAATGTGDSAYTYTYPKQKLYVMHPDNASIQSIHDRIAEIQQGA